MTEESQSFYLVFHLSFLDLSFLLLLLIPLQPLASLLQLRQAGLLLLRGFALTEPHVDRFPPEVRMAPSVPPQVFVHSPVIPQSALTSLSKTAPPPGYFLSPSPVLLFPFVLFTVL